jgi:hypothetical protein
MYTGVALDNSRSSSFKGHLVGHSYTISSVSVSPGVRNRPANSTRTSRKEADGPPSLERRSGLFAYRTHASGLRYLKTPASVTWVPEAGNSQVRTRNGCCQLEIRETAIETCVIASRMDRNKLGAELSLFPAQFRRPCLPRNIETKLYTERQHATIPR